MNNRDELDRADEEAIDAFLHRSSVTYLECSINLMLSHMTIPQVAEILRAQAELLEELG